MKSFDEILDFEYKFEDAEANSLREYFAKLLFELWREGEGFSGKRPFGNSDWDIDIYYCLATQELYGGWISRDEDGWSQDSNLPREKYNELVFDLIAHCFGMGLEEDKT